MARIVPMPQTLLFTRERYWSRSTTYYSCKSFEETLQPEEKWKCLLVEGVQHMEEDLILLKMLVPLRKIGSRVRAMFSMKQVKQSTLWTLLCIKPASLQKTGVLVQEVQPVLSWGGFNSMLHPELPSASKIAYCPMIEGSSTKMQHSSHSQETHPEDVY